MLVGSKRLVVVECGAVEVLDGSQADGETGLAAEMAWRLARP